MPVAQVTLYCPCCARELEVILVGERIGEAAKVGVKPKRKRRSKREIELEEALNREQGYPAKLGS